MFILFSKALPDEKSDRSDSISIVPGNAFAIQIRDEIFAEYSDLRGAILRRETNMKFEDSHLYVNLPYNRAFTKSGFI